MLQQAAVMRLEGAVVDIGEDGVLRISIPFIRIVERKDIKIETIPVKHTKRELEVLRGILDLKANKEIAYDLNVAERTVKFYVSALLAKHRVTGRMQLVDKYRNAEGARHDLGS
jgi:DNA-binding NarL/FixJ family response regulator